MNDFVVVWRSDVWLPLLGSDGVFRLYFNGGEVWSVDYVTLSAYLLWLVLVVWLATLSIRLLRKLVCGAIG